MSATAARRQSPIRLANSNVRWLTLLLWSYHFSWVRKYLFDRVNACSGNGRVSGHTGLVTQTTVVNPRGCALPAVQGLLMLSMVATRQSGF